MRLDISKNTVRNIRVGLVSKILSIIFPFIVRTIFIKTLGAEYLGVNSLFTSILTILSISELGFSSAIVFSMYKAIADDDDDTINALLAFYKKTYRIIGTIVTIVGICLIPFLPSLINGTYPDDINITIAYLVFLFNTSSSYFLFAYRSSILIAFQRNDIKEKASIVLNCACWVVQIVLLLTVKNYYAFIAIMPIFTLLTNVVTAILSKKYYPKYSPAGTLSNELKSNIKQKVSGLFVNKLCWVSRNAFDSIFISMFLGLTDIAIYNNYYYIMTSVLGFIVILTNSMTSGIGNSVASESVEKNYSDMKKLNFVYMWICGFCTVCLLCLYQPFMRIWMGPDLMLPFSSVILFCLYFYTLKMGDIRAVYADATGMWWQYRFRAVIEAICNVVLNYFLGKYFGLNGIIAATLISLFFINFLYGSGIIFKYYFTEHKVFEFFLSHLLYASVATVACLGTFFLCCFFPDNIGFFFIRIAVCLVVPNFVFLIAYRWTRIYRDSIPWALNRIGVKKTSLVYKFLMAGIDVDSN